MHAAVFRYDGVVGSTDELLPAGRRLAAALGRVPGFITYVLLDAGDGVLLAMSIFDSATDLQSAERLIAEQPVEPLSTPWPRPTKLSRGEIIVQRGL